MAKGFTTEEMVSHVDMRVIFWTEDSLEWK